MKIAAIHISDLHITNHKNDEGKIISESWLTTNFENYLNELSTFIYRKKKEFAISKLILIVSGDLSNTSEKGEYPQTKNFLKTLANKLLIEIEDILIVPGNHDINWDRSRLAFSKEREFNIRNDIKPYTFQVEKYEEFKNFYDDFYSSIKSNKKVFSHEKAIIDIIPIPEYQLAFIGLNSTFKCSHTDQFNKDSNGYINTDYLEKEIKNIKEDYPNWVIIAVFHHNAESNIEGNRIGIENWISVRKIFADYDVNTFIFGHEHTPGGFSLTHNMQFNYIATGSTGKKNIPNFFNLLIFNSEPSKLELNIKFCGLQKDGNKFHYDFGYWSELPDIDQQKEFVLREKNNFQKESKSLLPKKKSSKKKQQKKRIAPIKQPQILKDYSLELLKIIKENKLFKSGHFHWSDNAKAHNWLDTSKLLSKKEDLHLSKNAVINLIKEHNINGDIIIGLGLEGNVIASKTAVYFDKAYTYLPYSYRYSDHDSYEKKISLNGKGKTIIIITDVVHNGSTLTDIIKTKEKKFFNEVSKIIVIALFYTGKSQYYIDMLNWKEEQRIEFYYVCDEIKVEGCPYGEDFRMKCKIYSEKLDFVYEFYDAKRE